MGWLSMCYTAQRWTNKNGWHIYFNFSLVPMNFCISFSHSFSNMWLLCWCISLHGHVKHQRFLPLWSSILIVLPKSVSPDDKQPRQQLKGTKRLGKRLSPRRPCLSDTGPPLLTSINPLYCVVGGKGVDRGVLSNLILCDLGGHAVAAMGFWITWKLCWGYCLLWRVSFKIHIKVSQPAMCNGEYFISISSESGFKLQWAPKKDTGGCSANMAKWNFKPTQAFSFG